jgi:hypothetical protein
MIYRLRGADEGFSGLGAIAVPVYENCDPTDSACVARNLALDNAYNLALEQAANAQHLSQCLSLGYPAATCHAQFDPGGTVDSTANAGQPIQGYSLLQSQTQATPSGGHVTFTTSRGSNALQVGDTWLVSITGASPNTQVTATVGTNTTPMGTTDSSGSFSLAGTARTQDIGPWNESWAVGGVPSGAFSFTISPVAAGAPSGSSGGTSAGGGSAASKGSAAGASSSSTVIGGFDLSSIPTWGWLAAAGVAAFFLFGKGGR